MSDELTKVKAQDVDGFEGYEDQIEGDERLQAGGVIQGAVVKFTNEASWVTRDGEELPPDLELIAVDIGRVVQKWKDQAPVETRILQPGQKFPDITQLNLDTPRSEWTKGPDDKPRGPWLSATHRLPAQSGDDGSVQLADRHHWRSDLRP
jgi:hypothetical protein